MKVSIECGDGNSTLIIEALLGQSLTGQVPSWPRSPCPGTGLRVRPDRGPDGRRAAPRLGGGAGGAAGAAAGSAPRLCHRFGVCACAFLAGAGSQPPVGFAWRRCLRVFFFRCYLVVCLPAGSTQAAFFPWRRVKLSAKPLGAKGTAQQLGACAASQTCAGLFSLARRGSTCRLQTECVPACKPWDGVFSLAIGEARG